MDLTNLPKPDPEVMMRMSTRPLPIKDPRLMELEFQIRQNEAIQEKLSEVTAAIKDKNWVERHPVQFAVYMAILSALISAVVSGLWPTLEKWFHE